MNERYPLSAELLENTIGYKFGDGSYLTLALTHSSYTNEKRARGDEVSDCYERLEFLGDSVLSYIVSRHLYKSYPKLPEGHLSPIRAAAVCEKTLYKLAKQINLGDYLYLGHGESISGRTSPSILADVFEAVLGAMFLDGGIEPVVDFLMPKMESEISDIVKNGLYLDFKTELQQLVQQERGSILEYVTVSESGPAHKKTFEVEAMLNGNVIGRGEGSSKRSAEQLAAKEALGLFGFRIAPENGE